MAERTDAAVAFERTAGLAARLIQAADVLRARFGHLDFRHGQYRAVRAALAGRSALVVLPTGGGKSLCYQVPALVLDGLCVVVSPLISLMQDQVHAARARGIWAAALTSAQPQPERERVLRDLETGGLRLLYVAPERLVGSGLIGTLRRRGVALLAVDEAHCVSEWGHDFRPAYRRIGYARLALSRPPTLALTATATRAVRDDIVDTLRLGLCERIVGSFDRPNLSFAVTQVKNDAERRRRLLAMLKPYHGSAIVYVPTRVGAERWARSLLMAGVRAAPYHAGLEHGVRRGVQHEFLADHLDCVVATSAFGMGIDTANAGLISRRMAQRRGFRPHPAQGLLPRMCILRGLVTPDNDTAGLLVGHLPALAARPHRHIDHGLRHIESHEGLSHPAPPDARLVATRPRATRARGPGQLSGLTTSADGGQRNFIASSPTFACACFSIRASASPRRCFNPSAPASRNVRRHASNSWAGTWTSRLTTSIASPRSSRRITSVFAFALHRFGSAWPSSCSATIVIAPPPWTLMI